MLPKQYNTPIRSARGLRSSPHRDFTESEIAHLKAEINAINADESRFVFETGRSTAYYDKADVVYVSPNVFPDLLSGTTHPRDLMSERAALAHEYYGHRTYRNTDLEIGSWNDEFRASYTAAKTAPNLSDADRRYLVLDAIERAKEAGVAIKYNAFMKGVVYGY